MPNHTIWSGPGLLDQLEEHVLCVCSNSLKTNKNLISPTVPEYAYIAPQIIPSRRVNWKNLFMLWTRYHRVDIQFVDYILRLFPPI